jgi:lipopolysaccharide export system protein LptA
MKRLILAALLIVGALQAEELKITAKSFETDEQRGRTVFTGDVRIIKGSDELNASVVTILVDENRRPKEYVAEGDVSFVIHTENKEIYAGKAQKVEFLPAKKKYRFFRNVTLRQRDKDNTITGDEVVVDLQNGRASASGADKKPVMMIFKIDDANVTHD